MNIRYYIAAASLACSLLQASAQNEAQASAQVPKQEFQYPTMPDTLHTVEQRASYLSEHYWDNFHFGDTLQLRNPDIVEQGFVNFIDILSRFNKDIAQKGVASFTTKAFANTASKSKFESLIEHYFEDPQSPMRNDRVYLLFLEQMMQSPHFDETEKERLAFKFKSTNKNLPGDVATDFTFKGKDGKSHQLSEYKNKKVILYFYDPECENCHKVTAWLKQQTIPTDIEMLRIVADTQLYDLYSLKAMPTIYLLDVGNQVVLKDCTPEMLIQVISQP